MNLFINACISANEKSRTLELAEFWIKQNWEPTFETIDLQKTSIKPLSKETIQKRIDLSSQRDFSDDLFLFAKQFAKADEILIAAPYWDLSFPAILKTYLELVCAYGVTFVYKNDASIGLSKAKKITYITTAGGIIGSQNLGGDYIKGVANFLGITNYEEFRAERLDMEGSNVTKILQTVKASM